MMQRVLVAELGLHCGQVSISEREREVKNCKAYSHMKIDFETRQK